MREIVRRLRGAGRSADGRIEGRSGEDLRAQIRVFSVGEEGRIDRAAGRDGAGEARQWWGRAVLLVAVASGDDDVEGLVGDVTC